MQTRSTLRQRSLAIFLTGIAFLMWPIEGFANKITVRTDFSPWGIHAALHLAAVKGWFKEAGLDVEIQDGKGTINTIQLVAAGHVDVGQVQLGLMAPARNSGLPVKSFAGWIRKADLAAMVDKKLNAKSVKDLKGRTLVLFAQNPFAPYVDTFLRNGGLERKDVNILFVEPASMVATYTAGRADGILAVGPFGLPNLEKSRPATAILAADYGIAFPSYGLMANEQTIKERSEELRKLVTVQARAWKYIYDGNHVDEAVEAIVKQRPEANLDRAVLKGQIVMYKDFLYSAATQGKAYGWQAEKDWEDAIKVMEEAKMIKIGSRPSDYYTNAFVATP